MEIIGLIWELTLFGIAVYFYALMRGFIKGKTREQQNKIEAFRAANQWLTYASIILGAIMVINLYLRMTGFSTN